MQPTCKVTFSQARKRRERRINTIKHVLAFIACVALLTASIGWLIHTERLEMAKQKQLDAEYCAMPGHSETYCYDRKD